MRHVRRFWVGDFAADAHGLAKFLKLDAEIRGVSGIFFFLAHRWWRSVPNVHVRIIFGDQSAWVSIV